jgi:hypothetical protein
LAAALKRVISLTGCLKNEAAYFRQLALQRPGFPD